MAIGDAVVVSGGSGGLGAAVCSQLSANGYRVLVGYRLNEACATEHAKKIRGVAVKIDLADPLEAIRSVDSAIGSKKLHAIVLAGTAPPKAESFRDLDPAALRLRLESDLFGTQKFLMGLVETHMKPNRSGTVVQVLSQAMGTPDRATMPNMAGYIVAKYATAGLCAALSADYKWLKLRTIMPGLMDTKMLQAFDPRLIEILKSQNRISPVEPVAQEILSHIVESP